MTIYSVFIINRAGGLIYEHDHAIPKFEAEKTFSFPLEPVLKIYDEKVMVAFGQRDNIKVGHTVLAINGVPAVGRQLEDNRDILEIIADESNYPLDIKFGRQKLSTNEKIMWASTFHSLYAISSQLSPVPKSSGIQVLEVDTFKLQCTQTLTGIKFVMITDPRQGNQDAFLRRMHEIYADYALKNPFYSIDMPIRCKRFDDNLKQAIEFAERIAYTN